MKIIYILLNIVTFVYSHKLPKNYEKISKNVDRDYKDLDLTKLKKVSKTEEVFNEVEEQFIQDTIDQNITYNDTIRIPTVWHVIHNDDCYRVNGKEFCDYDRDDYYHLIRDRVKDMNKDYNAQNPNTYKTPAVWKHLIGNMKLEFYIKDIKYVWGSKNKYWSIDGNNDGRIDDKMKFSRYGGSDVVDPDLNLNIWLVMFDDEDDDGYVTAGYAQFPGQLPAGYPTDGIVVDVRYSLEDAGTLTHEIGHWGNLRHIWGDGGCDYDDGVDDTPVSDSSYIYCTEETCAYPTTASCGTPDMFMNFMSYGSVEYMFTKGQVQRLRAIFEKGSYRYSIVTQEHGDAYRHRYGYNWDWMAMFFVTLIAICGAFLFIRLCVNLCLHCNSPSSRDELPSQEKKPIPNIIYVPDQPGLMMEEQV